MSRAISVLAVVCSTLVLAAASHAQLSQGTPMLVGSGAVGPAYQGEAVTISADGNTAVVGGSADAGSLGAAWVFARSAGAWSQQGLKLVGTGAVGMAAQGMSVALSADGSTIAVSGPFDDGSKGAVWIFIRSGDTWSQEAKLIATDAAGPARFGWGVALSGDGNTLISGGVTDDSGIGAAWIFARSGGVWSQQGPKLVATSAYEGDVVHGQGESVAISADGGTALVVGTSDYAGVGAWIYVREGNSWQPQGSPLPGGDEYQGGPTVGLSADGNTAVVSSYGQGARVFVRDSGEWTQDGPVLLGTGTTGEATQGWSVAISADGNVVLMGGVNDGDVRGAAWVFVRRRGHWFQHGPKLVGAESGPQSRQGWSVGLSADGSTAIIGGPGQGGGPGAAWIFARFSLAILAARDVPADQGGRLRLTWRRSTLDSFGLGADQITSYAVWRRIPFAASQSLRPARNASSVEDSLGLVYDHIATVPAIQSPSYNVVVPTLADSSAMGVPYFTFLVTAHTANPDLIFSGAPDSGYSADNLAPPQPLAFTATWLGGATHLDWDPSPAADFSEFRLYRGEHADFAPDEDHLVQVVRGSEATDVAPSGAFYKLSAVDRNGNEGPWATLGPVATGDAGPGPWLFELRGISPNPLRAQPLRVDFTLPQSGAARIELFDLFGRRRVSLEPGILDAGPHSVDLAATRALPPGIYVVRLSFDRSERTTRVTVFQ
jgi:hypothetical protein